jgi:hypothetical protein
MDAFCCSESDKYGSGALKEKLGDPSWTFSQHEHLKAKIEATELS